MLIGRDGISNDIITLGTCFSKFVYIRALPLRADWWKSDSWVDGEPRELEEEFKFQFDLERTDPFQRVLMNSLVLRG